MVITHNSTSTQEIIVQDKTGLMADSSVVQEADGKDHIRADAEDLAARLTAALTDTQLRHSLSSQARPITIDRFGKKVIAEQLLSYIEEYQR
jgi:glycosyltransferase involved in cell wall biosynthesis